MDVCRPEWFLPVGRVALADVAELGCPRGHSLAELRGEAVQRVLRHAERLQALVGEGRGDPGVVGGIGGGPAGIDDREQPAHQLATGRAVVHANQQIGTDVRARPLVQSATLDVVELQGHAQWWCSGRSGGSGFAGAR